ncbi:hypothetical protein ROZALSC1DRAFT_28774, partial [Rozella allomycis CSF55]
MTKDSEIPQLSRFQKSDAMLKKAIDRYISVCDIEKLCKIFPSVSPSKIEKGQKEMIDYLYKSIHDDVEKIYERYDLKNKLDELDKMCQSKSDNFVPPPTPDDIEDKVMRCVSFEEFDQLKDSLYKLRQDKKILESEISSLSMSLKKECNKVTNTIKNLEKLNQVTTENAIDKERLRKLTKEIVEHPTIPFSQSTP